MDKFLYEARPYCYGFIAFYALVISRSSFLMISSGLLMALSCILVSAMRYENRRALSRINVGVQKRSELKDPEIVQGQNKYHIK